MMKTVTATLATLVFFAAIHIPDFAAAQSVQRIAAIVNDDVVSIFDLQACR